MRDTLFSLLNLFLLFCLIATSASAYGTPPQYDPLGDRHINCTGSNCSSKYINKQAPGPFCGRSGERNKCDVCTNGTMYVCKDTCDSVSCGGGKCVIDETKCDEYTCNCYEGYIGKFCSDCATGYVRDTYSYSCVKDRCEGVTCNGRGTCVMERSVPFCKCNEGYYGKLCEVPDNCLSEDCTKPFEQCVTRDLEKSKCECWVDYVRNETTKECEKNLCASIICHENEACVKKGDKDVACECIGGYARNSTTNKCEEDVCSIDECGDNEECVKRGESSRCECKEGYIKYKEECVKDKCKKAEENSNDACNGHGVCYMKEAEALCDCYANYIGDYCNDCAKGFVIDRGTNECIKTLCRRDTCNSKGNCFMENGQAKCENCSRDYTGDYCEIPPNPCDEKYNLCPKEIADCERIGPEEDFNYTCTCKPGYEDYRCDQPEGFAFQYNVRTHIPSRRVKHFSLESYYKSRNI